MTQPTVKVLQIDQPELTAFVLALIGSPVTAGASSLTELSDVTLTAAGNGEHLVYNGAQWVNTLDLGFVTGDGLDAAAFTGSPRTVAVDTTVARRNATNTFQQTNTYTAAVGGISTGALFQSAAPGFILDDTGGAADESIWRTYSSGGQLIFDTRNDANSVSVNWLTVDRTGTTVDAINFAGTALTFNGIPLHVGSPQPSGGGGGDFVEAGSPETTINAKPLFLSDSFRVYDPGQSAYMDVTVDGASSAYLDLSSFGAVYFRSSGNVTEYAFGTTVFTLTDGKTIRIYDGSDALNFDIQHDGNDLYFDTNNSNPAHLTLDKIGIIYQGSPSTKRIVNNWTPYVGGGSGNDFNTVIEGDASWRIKPSDTQPLWVTRRFGSPTFDDVQTSTTNPTMRIGIGSPVTTNAEATLAILDNFSPGLVLRNTFTNTEVAITADNPNVSFTVDTDSFYTQSINSTGSPSTGTVNKVIFTASGGPDGEVDFQQLPISRVKLKTLTRTQNATDAFSISTNMVYFCSIGSPSGGFITVGGISGGVDGRIITIFNTNAGSAGSPSDASNLESIIFEHEEATALASARILCPNKFDVTIGEYECITLIYDGNEERWRVMSTTGPMSGA